MVRTVYLSTFITGVVHSERERNNFIAVDIMVTTVAFADIEPSALRRMSVPPKQIPVNDTIYFSRVSRSRIERKGLVQG